MAPECVVPLTGGGCGRALFLPHAIGGTVGFFAPVASRLGAVRDVYGLQCHGLDPWNEPDITIEAMAARYVEGMLAVDPTGPYEIVGYSMGGLLSLEIAHQLMERDKSVALTGVLDTLAPGIPMDLGDWPAVLRLISRAIGLDPPFQADATRGQELEVARFLKVAAAVGRVAPGFDTRHLRQMMTVYEVNAVAAESFQPGRFNGDLHCLFTERGNAKSTLAAWRALAAGNLSVAYIDADHFTLMREQHAEDVAAVLRQWLHEIDGRGMNAE